MTVVAPGRGRVRRLAEGAAALAVAAAVGAVFSKVGVPLAWVLGPLVGTAAFGLLGRPVFAPVEGRRAGQMIVGTSIGLHVTPAVMGLILVWLPAMVGTAALAMALGGLLSLVFARVAGIDRRTAFFAMMPGGLSEMANLGAQAGARVEPIALSQAIRVAVLVCALPPLIIALGIEGTVVDAASAARLDMGRTLVALATGLAGVGAAMAVRLNNPWMIGAIAGAGTGAALELVQGHLAPPLFILGQFLIGIAVGARFKRDIVGRLPRLCAASVVFTAVLALIMAAVALAMEAITGADIATMVLATSPGGLAEMALTAQVLHLEIALITAFHVVRAFMVNGFATTAWRLFARVFDTSGSHPEGTGRQGP